MMNFNKGIVGYGILIFMLSAAALQGQQRLSPKMLPGLVGFSSMPNSCNITVNAGPDITICAGTGKALSGMVTGGFTSYSWEPPDGLSNPDILNPIADPSSTTTYTLTARGVSSNRFTNGNFETGTIAPSTSSYTQYTNVNSLVMSTGGYQVMSVPQIAQAFGCNPNIGAFALVITPTAPNVNILCQTVAVNPNTEYKIDFKVLGILYILGSPPTIRVKINGNDVGSVTAESGLCLEADGSFMWNSGAATSANICFDNTGGQGPFSMCALDEITFRECCVEKDSVTVTVYDIQADVAMPDEINCNNRPMTLDGSGSSSGPGISYQWSTTNGKILRGDRTNMAVIDAPGTYKLKVIGQFGCEKEVSVTVMGNVTPPDLSTQNTDIDCKNPLARIEARSRIPGVTYEWTGPNGYSSSRSFDNSIREPGEYEVTITDDYGCKTTAKLEVKDNRTEVDIRIIGDTIRCGQDSVLLQGTSVSLKPEFEWTLPVGTKISSQNIFASDTGWYKLLVKDSLGCSVLDSFYVFNYKSSVPVSIFGDTLNCLNSKIRIRYQTDTSGVVNWRGPNGFFSNSKQPEVTDSGWYFLNLTTKDGCVGVDSVYISGDFQVPDVQLTGADTLDCNRPIITLTGQSNTMGSGFSWTGPNGPLGGSSQITVSDSGTYALLVTGPNGCISSAQIRIYADLDTPSVLQYSDTLNCIKSSVVLDVTQDTLLTFDWKGPGGFASAAARPVVSAPGEYTLVVRGKNGCPRSAAIVVAEDRNSPSIGVNVDTITCDRPKITPSVFSDSLVRFSWSGPGGFSSGLKEPDITVGGSYTLTITGSNGCTSVAGVTVAEDLTRPTVSLAADTITCKTTAEVSVVNLSSGARFNWFGPGGFSSTQATAPVTVGGWYLIEVVGINGCITLDSVFVFQKDVLPDIFTRDDTLDCSTTSLVLSGGSTTQGVSYEWTGPNGFRSTDPAPRVQDSGVYVLRVIDPNGCEATRSLQIFKFGSLPSIGLTQTDSLTCKDNNTRIRLSGVGAGDRISWSGPNGFSSTSDSAVVNTGGVYKVTVTNSFGCMATDSIIIVDLRSLPQADVRDDTINCGRRSLALFLNAIQTDLSFSWSGPGGFTSMDKSPVVVQGGNYQVTVTNSANCQLVLSLNIAVDTTEPDLTLLADTITCLRPSAPVVAVTRSQGFQIVWTGPNGFRYTLPQFATTVPGTYTATLTFSRNKCSTTRTIEIVEDTSRIRDVELQKDDARCGLANGSVNFLSVTGGAPGFEYSLDGGTTYSQSPDFLNLPGGQYQARVRDRNGCIFDLPVVIDSSSGVEVSLPVELTLQQGQSQNLNLSFRNAGQLTRIFWNPSDQLSCSDCQNPVLTATKDQLITVTVTDENGCTDEASIQIKVLSELVVYFPTAFSPNGDQINDYFFPTSGSGPVLVKEMSIYDRWGGLVFSRGDFQSDDATQGWDGRSRGQELKPGVYVYFARLELGTESLQYFGEITLIR